jgi:hypothetical protein
MRLQQATTCLCLKTIQSLQIFGVIKTMTFVDTHTRQIFSMSSKSFLGS